MLEMYLVVMSYIEKIRFGKAGNPLILWLVKWSVMAYTLMR